MSNGPEREAEGEPGCTPKAETSPRGLSFTLFLSTSGRTVSEPRIPEFKGVPNPRRVVCPFCGFRSLFCELQGEPVSEPRSFGNPWVLGGAKVTYSPPEGCERDLPKGTRTQPQ